MDFPGPSRSSPEPSRRTAAALIALLCVVGAWLRLSGTDYLLPHTINRDGLKLVAQVELMRAGAWDGGDEQRWNRYPHLLSRIVSLLPTADAGSARSLEEHLSCANRIWVQLRLVGALAGILLIPATYALARRFLDRGRSLLASGLVATSLLLTSLSHHERPHGLLTAALLVCVLAALRLRRNPTVGRYALAGLAAWLAAGALQSGFVGLFVLATAWWFRDGPRRGADVWKLLVTLLAVVVASWVFYPFAFDAAKPYEATEEPMLQLWGIPIFVQRFDGTGFAHMAAPLWNQDPLILVLVPCAFACVLVRRIRTSAKLALVVRRDVLVVLAFCAPFLLVFGLYRETAGRYVLPLVPFLACLAVCAVPRRWSMRALVLLAVPLVCNAHMVLVRRAPDTLEEAAQFVVQHVAPAERIAVIPAFDLPLFTAQEALAFNARPRWRSIWAEYQSSHPDLVREGPRFATWVDPLRGASEGEGERSPPLQALRAKSVTWVIVDVQGVVHPVLPLLGSLRAEADFVARISPLEAEHAREEWVPYGLEAGWLSIPACFRMLGARAFGPTLEIYRLR